MSLSRLVTKLSGAIRNLLRPPRTMFSEEELFYLDDVLVPDPDNPRRFTRASIVEAACYMMERGFAVKAGDNVGGDSVSATIDERMVEEAKALLAARRSK